jgi:hypothetical protein
MPATANIFVSYARADKGSAAAIVQALQGAGLKVRPRVSAKRTWFTQPFTDASSSAKVMFPSRQAS